MTSGIRERALEVVQVVLHFVGVVVEVQHHPMPVGECNDLAEQFGLGIELLGRFDSSCRADRGAQGNPAQFAQTRDDQLGQFEDLRVFAAIPHVAPEGRADDRQAVFLGEGRDSLHGVARLQGGVHQLNAVEPGIAHVGEDPIEDRIDVVLGLCCRVNPRVAPDNDTVLRLAFGCPGFVGQQRARQQCGARLEELPPGMRCSM